MREIPPPALLFLVVTQHSGAWIRPMEEPTSQPEFDRTDMFYIGLLVGTFLAAFCIIAMIISPEAVR